MTHPTGMAENIVTHPLCASAHPLLYLLTSPSVLVKLQQHVHCEIPAFLYRKSRDRKNFSVELMLTWNPTKYWLSVASFFFFLTFHQVFISNPMTKIEYVILCQCGVTLAGQCRGHLSFPLIPLRDEFKYLRSVSKLKIRLFTVGNVFLLYCCSFGWQGRRHNRSFHSVFNVISV